MRGWGRGTGLFCSHQGHNCPEGQKEEKLLKCHGRRFVKSGKFIGKKRENRSCFSRKRKLEWLKKTCYFFSLGIWDTTGRQNSKPGAEHSSFDIKYVSLTFHSSFYDAGHHHKAVDTLPGCHPRRENFLANTSGLFPRFQAAHHTSRSSLPKSAFNVWTRFLEPVTL